MKPKGSNPKAKAKAKTRAHGKKREDDVDRGDGLPTGDAFVDDFEDAEESGVAEVEAPKPLGRKGLLLKEPVAGKQKPGKVKKREQAEQRPSDSATGFKNRQRVMALSSRGITQRYRHLLQDLVALMPHSKSESKYDSKSNLYLLNELAELNNCNNCLFFEVRRATDLFLWLSRTPNGPSAKFHVQNVHTMTELRMTGNCLKGSRPIVSFDKAFDEKPHLVLLKELFAQVFSVPRTSRKLKPFVDHVMSFHILDGRIWIRNYQIVEQTGDDAGKMSLVEIGPRIVLKLIRIFDGSFSGTTLYAEEDYQTPSAVGRRLMLPHGARTLTRLRRFAGR
ncbi:Brix domain-containing protein [Hyaloraphidium curvatum]|nr:Brix domain-containing protein [Hyaloraphidium curvatum]